MNKRIVLYLVIIIVIFLSIGYAAFQISLNIKDIDLAVRLQEDIRVTSISVSATTNNSESLNEEYNVNNFSSVAYLPSANSTITYKVQVTNYGNTEEGISSIDEVYRLYEDGISETISSLEIKNMTYNLKDKLCDDINTNNCKLGSISTFYITIGYKNNQYNGNDTHYIRLDFNFNRVFNISYQGFDNISSFPRTIMESEVLSITFTNDIPVYLNVTNADGNYTSPTLTISNATNDIVISYICNISYTNITTQNLPTQIIKGEDLNITFTDPDIESLDILVNNTPLSSYSFTNNTLLIENVSGNLSITANKTQLPSTVIVFEDDTNGTETQTSQINVPVNEYINQTFEYVNNSGRIITSIRLEIVYTKSNSGNTSGQYLVGRLSYGGNSMLSNQVEIPKQSATNQTLLIGEFNNLSIPSNTNITFQIDLSNSNFSNANVTIVSQTVTATYQE